MASAPPSQHADRRRRALWRPRRPHDRRRCRRADQYASQDIDVCGFGVHNFDEPADVEPALDFAVDLGAAFVTCHVDPADRATIEAIDADAA
jgi:hypothetical protein